MEVLNKFSIFGFFGVLPRVNLNVKEINKPVIKLLLLISIYGDPGKYVFTFNLLDPQSQLLKTIELAEMELIPKGTSAAAVGIGDIAFPTVGKYTVQLLHNENEFYRESFTVAIADPAIFEN